MFFGTSKAEFELYANESDAEIGYKCHVLIWVSQTEQDALLDISVTGSGPLITSSGAPNKVSMVCFVHFNNLSHWLINIPLPANSSLTKAK